MISDCPCGFAFFLPDHIHHLAVVIVELNTDPEQVIVANLTSYKYGADTTVVLHKGDHPFIKYKTIVDFERARPFTKSDLISRINKGLFKAHDTPFSPDKVKIMQQGILDSESTENDIRELCEKALNNNNKSE